MNIVLGSREKVARVYIQILSLIESVTVNRLLWVSLGNLSFDTCVRIANEIVDFANLFWKYLEWLVGTFGTEDAESVWKLFTHTSTCKI